MTVVRIATALAIAVALGGCLSLPQSAGDKAPFTIELKNYRDDNVTIEIEARGEDGRTHDVGTFSLQGGQIVGPLIEPDLPHRMWYDWTFRIGSESHTDRQYVTYDMDVMLEIRGAVHFTRVTR